MSICADRSTDRNPAILSRFPHVFNKGKAKGSFNMKLTQARLKELLHYNPEMGVFTWLKTVSNSVKAGFVAGGIDSDGGYRRIRIDGKRYRSSRLAWLYMEGYFPEHEMDHRNRIKHDDGWENLRHVSHQCNTRNKNIYKTNRSGIAGVCWHKRDKKWHVSIRIFGKLINLGTFNSKLNAAKARWGAEVKHGFPNCNTISTAYLYLKERGQQWE